MSEQNLFQKLIEVRKQIPYAQKDAKHGNTFDYVSSSGLLEQVRPLLDDHGILIIPSVLKTEVKDHEYKNSKAYFTEITISYLIVNAEKPDDKITIQWYGQGIDSGEKGVGKAYTYAEKYLFLKLFNIPTDVDDPDAHAQNTQRTTKNKPVVVEETPITGITIDQVSMVSSLYDKLIVIKGKAIADGFYQHAKKQANITEGIETGTPEQIAKVIQLLENKLGV